MSEAPATTIRKGIDRGMEVIHAEYDGTTLLDVLLEPLEHALEALATLRHESAIALKSNQLQYEAANRADARVEQLESALRRIADAEEDWTVSDTGFSRLQAIADVALEVDTKP